MSPAAIFTSCVYGSNPPALTDYGSLCKQMCESHDKIIGAWVFGTHELIASYVRPRFAEPERGEQEKMFVQAQILRSIVSTNEGMYGKVKYIAVSFENFDAYLFTLEEEHEGETTMMSIGCLKPYSIEAVVASTEKVLASNLQ